MDGPASGAVGPGRGQVFARSAAVFRPRPVEQPVFGPAGVPGARQEGDGLWRGSGVLKKQLVSVRGVVHRPVQSRTIAPGPIRGAAGVLDASGADEDAGGGVRDVAGLDEHHRSAFDASRAADGRALVVVHAGFVQQRLDLEVVAPPLGSPSRMCGVPPVAAVYSDRLGHP